MTKKKRIDQERKIRGMKPLAPATATKSEIVEMLREYWETRPRGESREQTALRIGTHRSQVAAILAGTRSDLGIAIPKFFGYAKPEDEIYVRDTED